MIDLPDLRPTTAVLNELDARLRRIANELLSVHPRLDGDAAAAASSARSYALRAAEQLTEAVHGEIGK